MATEILLTSEKFVKSVSSISDNVAGKYILPAIREAQEVGFRRIVGDALLDKLKALYAADELDKNPPYLHLVEKSQYYLAYAAIVDIVTRVTYKVGNFGVAKSDDENLRAAGVNELSNQREYYQSKADACCMDLQNFILAHKSDYPELTENTCYQIKANLQAFATCGIFLGGVRGRHIK